jgi:hypothetical protein
LTAETLGVGDRRWDELVAAAPEPDVYYRPGYCAAYEAAGHGQVVAVATEHALWPLLLRPLPFGETGRDAATPYGYGGLLPTGPDAATATDLEQLRDWCVANDVVSVLVRLHPLLGGPAQVAGLAGWDGLEVRDFGPTVAVDPRRIDAETGRLAGMSKGRKADLTIARRELELTWGTGEEPLETFRGIYDATMQRLGAGEFYLFPREYYRSLAGGLSDNFALALTLRGGEPVGGALFLADSDGGFAHYHLSGTTDAGRELKAGTLLVHAGAEWAAQRGAERFHLGGGTSGADSLFAFKKSFGGEQLAYCFVTLVADARRYETLVARRSEEPEPPRPGFVPAYRA